MLSPNVFLTFESQKTMWNSRKKKSSRNQNSLTLNKNCSANTKVRISYFFLTLISRNVFWLSCFFLTFVLTLVRNSSCLHFCNHFLEHSRKSTYTLPTDSIYYVHEVMNWFQHWIWKTEILQNRNIVCKVSEGGWGIFCGKMHSKKGGYWVWYRKCTWKNLSFHDSIIWWRTRRILISGWLMKYVSRRVLKENEDIDDE